MTKRETTLSTAIPCCYCCLRETDLVRHNNGQGLNYWLCSECNDSGFQMIDGLAQLVCPVHGIQYHYDVINHEFVQKRAKAGYYYNYPVHTKRTKEKGLKPLFGICKYDEVERKS